MGIEGNRKARPSAEAPTGGVPGKRHTFARQVVVYSTQRELLTLVLPNRHENGTRENGHTAGLRADPRSPARPDSLSSEAIHTDGHFIEK